jgi:small subunit ribosomal protein S6
MEQRYESFFILNPRTSDEEAEKKIAKMSQIVTQAGGVIEKAEKWGKRKLAYDIKGVKEGNYIYMLFKAPSTSKVVTELERTYRVSEDILRFITTRIIDVKKIPAKLRRRKKKLKPVAAAPTSGAPAPTAATRAPTTLRR